MHIFRWHNETMKNDLAFVRMNVFGCNGACIQTRIKLTKKILNTVR